MNEKKNLNKKNILSVQELWLVISCVYIELALHFVTSRPLSVRIIFPALFGAILGAIFAFITSLVKKSALKTALGGLFIFAFSFWTCVHLVYFAVFGGFLSLSLVGMGGDVFKNFGSNIIYAIQTHIPWLVTVFLPLIFYIVYFAAARKREAMYSKDFCRRLALWALGASLMLCIVFLDFGRDNTVSAYKMFVGNDTQTDTSISNLGVFATTIQEARCILFPAEETEEIIEDDALSQENFTQEINEYTGLFEGYNLISICAESFSPWLIDEELTPALYKLANGGFIFDNYYGTFQNVTTNGEMSFCTGLYPDFSRSKAESSFVETASIYLPYCLGNALGAKGYTCYAYHANEGYFYNRNLTHPNMGYNFKSIGAGLDCPLRTPSSDLEMIQASIDDYISLEEPFHIYYMTYSGHYQYNFLNDMAAKNKSVVENLDYSDTVKAYISCNMELEYALEYLLQRLEESGKADNTVIVLTNDHYPYGLTEEEYNELAGQSIDTDFEKYRNSFICYVPGMAEHVETYCSTVDILPTLLNLFSIDYDPGLLAGTDVFSDGTHMAVLYNKSFITDKYKYNAETAKLTYQSSGETVSLDKLSSEEKTEVTGLASLVTRRMNLSVQIVKSDAYAEKFNVDDSEKEGREQYSDLVNIVHIAAVGYMEEHGYVKADSEEIFGGDRDADIAEAVDILKRMVPSSTCLDEYLGCHDPLTNTQLAVMLKEFAKEQGVDVSNSTLSELLTPDEIAASDYGTLALAWCCVSHAYNKNYDNLLALRDTVVNRFQLTSYTYALCTKVLMLD